MLGGFQPPWGCPDLPPPPVDPRPIPPGWIQSFDRSTNHYYYTDMNYPPYKSWWEHPCDLGYDPSIYGRHFTYDESLAGRKNGYGPLRGLDWMRNLHPPGEPQMRFHWRDGDIGIPDFGDESSDDDHPEGYFPGSNGYKKRTRRARGRTRRRKSNSRSRSRGQSADSYRGQPRKPLPDARIQQILKEYQGLQQVGQSSSISLPQTIEIVPGDSGRQTLEISPARSVGDTTRPASEQALSRSADEAPDRPDGQVPNQRTRQTPSEPTGQIPRQPAEETPSEFSERTLRQSAENSRGNSVDDRERKPLFTKEWRLGPEPKEPPEPSYAAFGLDHSLLSSDGIYPIPRSLRPWAPPPPPAPPPSFTSSTGSAVGGSRAPRLETYGDDVAVPMEERRYSPVERDSGTMFCSDMDRGHEFSNREKCHPRPPPSSPTPLACTGESMRTVPENLNTEPDGDQVEPAGDASKLSYPLRREAPPSDLPEGPLNLADRFRKALHLHVPTAAEKAAKKEYKQAARAKKEAETAHRNQRRYEAAADRMKKYSELLEEMNRREIEIYQTQALKERMGFNSELFEKRLAEGILMNNPLTPAAPPIPAPVQTQTPTPVFDIPGFGPMNQHPQSSQNSPPGTNQAPNTAPFDASGTVLDNPLAHTLDADNIPVPDHLNPSPNPPIGMAVDANAKATRARNIEDNQTNKLRTPAPSAPRFNGNAPQLTPDNLWRRHALDSRDGSFVRKHWAPTSDETDLRYGELGSGRFRTGSPTATRWAIDHRGFRQLPHKPSIFGGGSYRHPPFFDYGEYDQHEHEWDGGGYHGAAFGCGF
ncbi:hypothetical protein TWF730_004455 [Orbilia blumenaviensis]|uniref:BZIP domain-containing protein n=1 Tax=Orbilia blumenaviensis TaxID=1796055 RepID=A0AAV9U2K4_9PEZI